MKFWLFGNCYFPCLLFSIIFFLAPDILSAQKLTTKGRIIGSVKDDRSTPLPGATIRVGDSGMTTTANVDGNFELDLLPGSYSIYISFTGKVPDTVSVEIKKGEITRSYIVLTSKSQQEVVVTARKKAVGGSIASVYAIQRTSSSVADVMSINQIRNTPDNNLGQAVARISGVTIVDKKFVVVRGMSERYNNILINGSQLPSTEINRKNFALDLIPANLVENIVVSKTASPDLPADFTGGLVQVNTKEVPEKNALSITVGTGYNTLSTGEKFLSTEIASSEYYAKFDDKRMWYLRDWDPAVYFVERANPTSLTKANELNSRIPNFWGLQSYTAKPTQDYQLSGGFRKRFKNKSSFGMIAAITYRNEQSIEEYQRQTEFGDSIAGNRYLFNTSIGGLLSFSYNIGSSKFSFKNLYLRKLSHDNYVFSGKNPSFTNVRNYASLLNVTDILQNRLEGEHQLKSIKNIRIKWFIDKVSSRKEQPDNRTMLRFLGTFNTYDYAFSDAGQAGLGGVASGLLEEDRYGWGTDISIPINLFQGEQKLKIGYMGSLRSPDYQFTFLRPYLNDVSKRDNFFGLPDYEVYTPDNFKKGYFFYAPVNSAKGNTDSDTYGGEQSVQAGFAMVDLKIFPSLRLIGGVRAEDYKIENTTILKKDSTGKVSSDTTFIVSDFTFYPSVNIIYDLTKKSSIRLAFSKTVARFDFREFSPFSYYDFVLPGEVNGNPRLKNTYIFNADLRYEWYPTAEEVFTFSIFYKKFTNPIEPLIGPLSSAGYAYNTVNQKSSTNIGLELDFRKSLSFINKNSKFLKNLFISGNGMILQSEVEIDRLAIYQAFGGFVTVDTTIKDVRKRPLNGLSPYAVNAGILYDGGVFGINITYNRFGRRLLFANEASYRDFYENPRDQLDLQLFGRFIKRKMELKLNISDLLNQYVITYNNAKNLLGTSQPNDMDPKGDAYNPGSDFFLYKSKRGTTISISLGYRL